MNMKLHPSQFRVNEAWILFRLTFEPIITERDGPVVGFGLMDAASCFLLNGTFFLGTDQRALSEKNVQELLRKGWAHKKEYPSKLLVPEDILTDGIEKAVVYSKFRTF